MLVAYVCSIKSDLPKELVDKFDDKFFEEGTSVLVVEYDGKIILHKYDNCSAESNYFWRSYDWIDTMINDAYELGVEDGKNGNY